MERLKKLLIIQEGTILSSKNKKTYSEKNSCISRKFLYFRRKHAKPGTQKKNVSDTFPNKEPKFSKLKHFLIILIKLFFQIFIVFCSKLN